MIEISKVTIVIVDCVDYNRSKFSLDHSCSKVKFKEAKLLSHFDEHEPYSIKIDRINSIRDYSKFLIKNLTDYFDTEFVINAQHDGFVWNPEMWSDEFYEYDYIGAPWPEQVLIDGMPKHFNVGNGGFSLRSKRLQDFLKNDENIILSYAEDVAICQLNRMYLISKGFKFAPYEVAKRFSYEHLPWKHDEQIVKAFGCHGFNLIK